MGHGNYVHYLLIRMLLVLNGFLKPSTNQLEKYKNIRQDLLQRAMHKSMELTMMICLHLLQE